MGNATPSETRIDDAEDGPDGERSSETNRRSAISAGEDTGRTVKNVLANWAGQTVTVASGFVIPRLLEGSLGREQLGVWDTAWSIRTMISMSSFSMASSVGYYVSRFRATGNWTELNRKVATTSGLVAITAVLAFVIALAVAYFTPWFMTKDTVEIQRIAQLMFVAMGLAASLQMLIQLFGGVVVGCHRFDLLNKIEIVVDVLMVAGFFAALLFGGGLALMGGLVVARQLGDMFAKRVVAKKLCPQVSFVPRWNDWSTAGEIAGYGTKTMANTVATIITNQFGIMVLTNSGGVAMAPFLARPRALILFATRFVMGFARVLVPKAGELSEKGSKAELAELFIGGTRAGMFLTLPLVAGFVCLGSQLMTVWMGPDYADQTVLTILVLGSAPYLAQRPTWHFLMGIGEHGRVSFAALGGSIVTIGLSILFIQYWGWEVEGAAWAMVIPLLVVNALVTPWVGRRVTEVSMRRFLVESHVRPVLAVIPLVAALLAVRWSLGDRPLICLLVGTVVGGLVLAIVYWFLALPPALKQKLTERLRRRSKSNLSKDQGSLSGTIEAGPIESGSH
jgi:O-antigen/teichoic acid export membrane protein